VEIIKEANMRRIIGQKEKSTGKNHNPSFNRIRFNEFVLFVIGQLTMFVQFKQKFLQ
jgi:hypothetical protein